MWDIFLPHIFVPFADCSELFGSIVTAFPFWPRFLTK
jgi:hypothetical protein